MNLVASDFAWAAAELDCEVDAIRAVAQVESVGSGFDKNGSPRILFEAHKFSEHTGHRYDLTHPRISSLRWNRALYTGHNADEHARLAEAVALDREAALKSASWGLFQILGENWALAGYPSLQAFINAMFTSERTQLEAFVGFIANNERMRKALRNKDWAAFARRYNGPRYAVNGYDKKLAAAYKLFHRPRTLP
jgi:hypothetical protein